ncbi:MAG: outer membrane protein assembly factor BamE [Gemmobacter sp.]
MAKAGQRMRMAAAAIALIAVAGCSAVYRNHGYVPTEGDLASIAVGVDTRDTVAQALGHPSAGGVLGESDWYYVQSRWRHYGARAPREIERQVLAVSFDGSDRVANIERFGLENGQVVTLSRRVTETSVRDIGLVRQLMRNLGNFQAGQFFQQ